MNQKLSFVDVEAKPAMNGLSRMFSGKKRRAQRGAMLIDVALALTIATIALTGQFAQTTESVDESIAKATGQWAVEYQGALNNYYSTNGQTIMAGQSVAGVASPYQPTVTELINLGYLPAGFSGTAPNGQKFTATVSEVCPGGNCALAGYMYSTTPYKDESGRVRNDLAGLAMQSAGADAGMTTPGHAGQLVGTGNGWQASIAGIPVGTFAMRIGSYSDMDEMLSQFYMLNGSRMLTGPMNANNNSMSNVSTFQATGNVKTTGGTFVSTAPPAGIGVQIANAQIYGDGSNIALRAPGAAYIQTTSGGWATLNSGSLNVTGDAYITGNTTVNGTTVLNGTNYLQGSTVVTAPMYMQTNGGVNTSLPLAATATAGQGCSGNQITTDPSGNILACQSGVWQKSFGNGYIQQKSQTLACGQWSSTATATCPSGYTMTGGGYQIENYAGSGAGTPDISEPLGNGWSVSSGDGTAASTCWWSFAVCIK